MAEKLILEIHVKINEADKSVLNAPEGEVIMIPFGGTAEGSIFHGRVLPGGTDTQRVNLAGVRHMSARYMLEGEDSGGAHCRIFIENEGWFENLSTPFRTVPTMLTDSPTLAPYLRQRRFRGEGQLAEGGVCIRIFDVQADETE